MKPLLSIVTLGVRDFARSLRFYKALGWTTSATETDLIAFFQLNGVVLALFPLEKLAEDATVKSDGSGFAGITLAHNVVSEADVDELLGEAEKLGAKIVKKGQRVFWGGYSGYFADPDGYLWEVAHNPFWKLDENGNPVMS